MIPCICIDDENRPNDIPLSKWLKEGENYHITSATVVLPQGILGFKLKEIELDANCLPYSYYSSHRFIFEENYLKAVQNMVMDAGGIDEMFERFIEPMKMGQAS